MGNIIDEPITKKNEDVLGRTGAALDFFNRVMEIDAGNGAVVGVMGPWGSGKTSFINLTRTHFENAEIPIVDFNPWIFSGTEHLVDHFFSELSAQLKIKKGFKEITKKMDKYADLVLSVPGIFIPSVYAEPIKSFFKGALSYFNKCNEEDAGVSGAIKTLKTELLKIDKPILVILDDVDRLNGQEIREIFKLVRLTASLPNIIYILAFDRLRVEHFLTEEGIPGRDYLEKILQIPFDIPAIPTKTLYDEMHRNINIALEGLENSGPFDEKRWIDVFMGVIFPLIRNMRDVNRYSAAIRTAVRSYRGDIALVDLLAMEAIRLFLPDVYYSLHKNVEILTDIKTNDEVRPPSQRYSTSAELINAIIASGKINHDVVTAMIKNIFPAGSRHISNHIYGHDELRIWLRERRLAHEDNLKLYLEKAESDNLTAFRHAEKAISLMGHAASLKTFMGTISPVFWESTIASLENLEDQFTDEMVVPTSIVLFNLLSDMPEKQRGLYDFDARTTIRRVVLRLMRKVTDRDLLETFVLSIMRELKNASKKYDLTLMVGYRENTGHKLVSETFAKKMEVILRDQIIHENPNCLAEEELLLNLMLFVRDPAFEKAPEYKLWDADDFNLALLKSAISNSRSQTMGSRYIEIKPRLAWKALLEIFDGVDPLKERIASLRANKMKGNEDIIILAERYLSGNILEE